MVTRTHSGGVIVAGAAAAAAIAIPPSLPPPNPAGAPGARFAFPLASECGAILPFRGGGGGDGDGRNETEVASLPPFFFPLVPPLLLGGKEGIGCALARMGGRGQRRRKEGAASPPAPRPAPWMIELEPSSGGRESGRGGRPCCPFFHFNVGRRGGRQLEVGQWTRDDDG